MPAKGRTWNNYRLLVAQLSHWSGAQQALDVTANPDPHEEAMLASFTQALERGDERAEAVLEDLNISRQQFRLHLRYIARWSAARRRLLAQGGNFQLLEGLGAEDRAGQLDGLVLTGARADQERLVADHLRRFAPRVEGRGWLAPVPNPGKPVREYTPGEVVWLYPARELQQADDLHPSVARSLIHRYLRAPGVVADPMAGSGTIARMATLMGHRAWASDLHPREDYIAKLDVHATPLQDVLDDGYGLNADLVFIHPPTAEELGLSLPAYLDWLTQVLSNCWNVVRRRGHVLLVVRIEEGMSLLARAERALIDSANNTYQEEGLLHEVEKVTAQHLAVSRDGRQGWHILVLQRPDLDNDAEG